MSRLPVSGADEDVWGNILNDFLRQSHNEDGTLADDTVHTTTIVAGSVTTSRLANNAVTAVKVDGGSSSDGDVLTIDSNEESGFKWAPPATSASFRVESGWYYSSTLAPATGTFKLYNDSGASRTIISVRASVNVAPTGASIVVDVNKGGTTIFTTQANRTAVAAGAYTGTSTPDVTVWENGTYLTADIDSVGSTVAGEDLTISVAWES